MITLPRPLLTVLRGYLTGLNRFADFSGRSSWQEYRSFLVVNLAITLLFQLGEYLTGNGFFATIGALYGLVVLIPGLAITVRLLRYVFTTEGSRADR